MNALNLLVVEDDEALRDALSITLEAAGHRVAAAASGPEALDLLDRGDFSMVVSDLRMDPMDGLQLLKEIRQRAPQLPVLLMTAFGDVDKAVAAMRGGACDCHNRPVPRPQTARCSPSNRPPHRPGNQCTNPYQWRCPNGPLRPLSIRL